MEEDIDNLNSQNNMPRREYKCKEGKDKNTFRFTKIRVQQFMSIIANKTKLGLDKSKEIGNYDHFSV